MKAAIPRDPYEPEYGFKGYKRAHNNKPIKDNTEIETSAQKQLRKTVRGRRRRATSQLTARVVSNEPFKPPEPTELEHEDFVEAEGNQEFIFRDTLDNAREHMTKSDFSLQAEFIGVQRKETAKRGSNTDTIDYYEESFKDTKKPIEFHQNDHLARKRDQFAATCKINSARAERGLIPKQMVAGVRRFRTLTAPPNNTQISNTIAKYNNPFRETYKDKDTRTTRQILRDEENDSRKLAFAGRKQEVARLSEIQKDPRNPYKWTQPNPTKYSFYRHHDLAHLEPFQMDERISNYHNQLHPGVDVNPTVGTRRIAGHAPRAPATDRSHHRPRRAKPASAPTTSGATTARLSQRDTRPFGFKLKEMPMEKEMCTGTLHVAQTVHQQAAENVPINARVNTKLRAQHQEGEVRKWIETKMGTLTAPEKNKMLGDIDHLLVDTQHPLRRGRVR